MSEQQAAEGSPRADDEETSDVEPAARQDVEPAARQDVEPAARKDVEPAARQDVEPAARKDVEPAARQDVEPAARQDVEPAARQDVEPAARARPAKKRKKKRKKRSRGGETGDGGAGGADDDERGAEAGDGPKTAGGEAAPLPGAGTPEGERLRRAVRAFEVGDYAGVRRLCAELEAIAPAELAARDAGEGAEPSAERVSEYEAVRQAAADLRGRTTVDPVQVVVVVACAAILLAIAYVWIF